MYPRKNHGSINGTKVECKVSLAKIEPINKSVLMEPKWNVKTCQNACMCLYVSVLMEPKWNVKHTTNPLTSLLNAVLMEPKWNVKGCNEKSRYC